MTNRIEIVDSDEITREKFIERVGRDPEQDDLERCNCPLCR